MNEYVQSLVIAGFIGLIGLAGYQIGHGKAEAEGLAAVNALKAEQSEKDRRNADAYGKAVADARERQKKEAGRANAIAAELAADKRRLASEAAKLRRKIADAVNPDTRFGPAFVSVFNQTTGAGIPDDPLSGTCDSGGAAGRAGTGAAPGPGLCAVGEKDLLEYMEYYGERCQGLEGQVRSLRKLLLGRGNATPQEVRP